MFEKILSPAAINVIETLSADLDSFYLAGGTALALQLGHRRSDDLDFFLKMPKKNLHPSCFSPVKTGNGKI